MATVEPNYAFSVIDPPTVPELKSEPKRALICVLGTLWGHARGGDLLVRRALRNRAEALADGAGAWETFRDGTLRFPGWRLSPPEPGSRWRSPRWRVAGRLWRELGFPRSDLESWLRCPDGWGALGAAFGGLISGSAGLFWEGSRRRRLSAAYLLLYSALVNEVAGAPLSFSFVLAFSAGVYLAALGTRSLARWMLT